MEVPQDHQLHPTHTCFDDALDFITAVLQQNPADRQALIRELMLVHAICLSPEGEPYAHAWVEHAGRCIFRGILHGTLHYYATSLEEYYAEMHVQDVTRYSPQTALDENKRCNTYGPWVPKYLALCRPRPGQMETAGASPNNAHPA